MATGFQDASMRWPSEIASPFTKLTRRVYPRTVREAFAWGEELWHHHGMYSQAIQTAVRYFMTEVELSGDEDMDYSTRKGYIQQIRSNFDVLEELAVVGDDYMGFGNSFTSLHKPFVRQLVCRGCGFRAPIKEFHKANAYRFEAGVFQGACPLPQCTWMGAFEHVDTPMPRETMKTSVTRWPAQFMEINQHPISGRSIYSINLQDYDVLRTGITQGDLLFLEDTPWEILDAVVKNQKFEFKDGELYHMAAPTIATSQPYLRGWGPPPFMANFETAVLVMMLEKYVEIFVSDYLVPFRTFSPPAITGENDVLLNMNMGDFVSSVKSMLNRHRKNPTDYNFLPFPLEYNVHGGEAAQMIPIEVLEHFEMRLLHSMGIPPEFYKSSIEGFNASTGGAIIGFKMFERTWQHFANELNKWATWLVNRQGDLMNWERVEATIKPVSLAEDNELRRIKLELAAGGKISDDTALAPLGIDSEQEDKKKMDEEERRMEESERRQKRIEERQINSEAARVPPAGEAILMQQQQEQAMAQGAAGPAGGAPPMPSPAPGAMGAPMSMPGGAGGSPGATIDDLMGEASQIAQQLLTSDPATRRQVLGDLKHTNEALYAQVKAQLSQMEQQAESQGRQLVKSGQIPVQ